MPDVDPAIAHLDWPICECQPCNGTCPTEATLQITLHALDCCTVTDPRLNDDGNRPLKMCESCYARVRDALAKYISLRTRYGRAMCLGCGAPLRCVRDVLRVTSKL